MAAPRFRDVLREIAELEQEGVIERYALVGAVAALFHAEAAPTFDLDVAILLPAVTGDSLLSLGPLYAHLAARGFRADGAHVEIHGVPVQFLPGDRGLWREVVEAAVDRDYDGLIVRVATPEHLVAMAWSAPEPKRLQRAAALCAAPGFDRPRLREILERHGIADRA